MNMKKGVILLVGMMACMVACKNGNPLQVEFDTPFEVPPFDRLRLEHYAPAFREAMRLHDAEIRAIVENTDEPTFENTIVALDRAGHLLHRVSSIFFNLLETDADEEKQALALEISPLLAAHRDAMMMNPGLFARIKALYDVREQLLLDTVSARALHAYYTDFVRGGALLDAEDKARVMAINAELSTLTLRFGDNLRRETDAFSLVIEDPGELQGLPESVVAAAAESAAAYGEPGKWRFTLHKPSLIPFLQYARERGAREKLYKGYLARGNNDNEHDNKEIIRRVVHLRQEKAHLLGFETYAAYILAENMARSSDQVYAFLERVWEPALKVAREELREMQEIARAEGWEGALESWDWWYYAEKLRKQKYDLDEMEIMPYLVLDSVREGMFEVATRLYGVTFQRREDIPSYRADVEVYEVKERDGVPLGVLYMDYFTRVGKSAGAWMTEFRHYSKVGERVLSPQVSLVFNFPPATKGKPVLLSWDNVETLFHEFGHALHGFFSRGEYRRVAGVLPMDMVELPSQFLENWAREPEVLKGYAKHVDTGEPMPDELIRKIRNSRHFNQGFATVEYIAASLLDLDWHARERSQAYDVNEFERASLEEYGLIKEILPRYRSTYFAHIFSGEYAAGYYVYLWAEVLDADAFQAFKESGDIYNPELAAKFRQHVLAEGGFGDPMAQYVKFRGTPPSERSLLLKRGLVKEEFSAN
ncbi:MAG: M3 family metallopeptidase [Odoribacteraceae bacterium]|jgi:peptidyl-dipeptidase Dcp|nr:M3 family metallopeptidase [Odoribacteraceae bacterium]